MRHRRAGGGNNTRTLLDVRAFIEVREFTRHIRPKANTTPRLRGARGHPSQPEVRLLQIGCMMRFDPFDEAGHRIGCVWTRRPAFA